jgi:hypothetical protein
VSIATASIRPLSAPDWQNADVTLQRLGSTDAFVVVDLPTASRADGIVRCAKKVLVDSSRALARSRSYAWALLQQPISGAAAGINAEGEGRADAVAAFCGELAAQAGDRELTLAPGKGLDPGELDALRGAITPDPAALLEGLLGCAEALTGGLSGKDVAIEHDGGAEGLKDALTGAGASVVAEGADALSAHADLLIFGSRPGLLDHELAGSIDAAFLLPSAEIAYTPRALAVSTRRGLHLLPDFLSTAGALAARCGLDARVHLGDLAGAALERPEGAVIGACIQAEDFLTGWVPELPFGRPIGGG